MSNILEELDDLWEKVSDIDSVTVLQAREEIVKLRAEARDAADEIEKLRAERDALRAVLRQIGNGDTCVALLSHPPICSRAMAARVVLGEKK